MTVGLNGLTCYTLPPAVFAVSLGLGGKVYMTHNGKKAWSESSNSKYRK